jgi:hypothetical protein
MEPEYLNADDLSKYLTSEGDMLKLLSKSFSYSETDAIRALSLAMKSGFVDSTFVDTAVSTITYERPKEPGYSWFESVADTDSAKQLQEERENLLVGIKALETTVMYHEDKSNELKNQLLIVEEQLSQLRPDSFKKGEFKTENSLNRYVAKLEFEIVRSIRISGVLSDKTIMINPETWHEIAAHIGVNWSEVTSRTKVGGLTYKGIPVVRSYDIEKGEIIVK